MKLIGTFAAVAVGLVLIFPAFALYVAAIAALSTLTVTKRALTPTVVVTALVLSAWLMNTVLTTPVAAPAPAKAAKPAVVVWPLPQDAVERQALASLRGAEAHHRMSLQERTWAEAEQQRKAAEQQRIAAARHARAVAEAEAAFIAALRLKADSERLRREADRAASTARIAGNFRSVGTQGAINDANTAWAAARTADADARMVEAQYDAALAFYWQASRRAGWK
jgi:hypothetical protein